MNIAVLEALPVRQSMRKSALLSEGGDLFSLYDVPRWDGCGQSRQAHRVCRKDWRCNSTAIDKRRARRAVRAIKEGAYGDV